jgi:hypothetical protein
MLQEKKRDLQMDETDENCIFYKPRSRKKSGVISNHEVESLVKRLFKYEQDRLEKLKVAKRQK